MPLGVIQHQLNFNDNFSDLHDALSFGSIQLTDSLHDATISDYLQLLHMSLPCAFLLCSPFIFRTSSSYSVSVLSTFFFEQGKYPILGVSDVPTLDPG
jgi:hypothetical protein